MINEEKLGIMIKLASYDAKQGKRDMKQTHYFRSDYLRLQIWKTIVAMTFGCILVMVMLSFYNLETIIAQAVTLNYRSIIFYVLTVFVLLLAIYVLMGWIHYSLVYARTRKRLTGYYENLKKLRELYEGEDAMASPGEKRQESRILGKGEQP